MAAAAYQRYFAEFLGTFGLLLFGVGTAEMTLNAAFTLDTRYFAISFAFGIVSARRRLRFRRNFGGSLQSRGDPLDGRGGQNAQGGHHPAYLIAQLLGALLAVEVILAIAQATSGNLLSVVQGNALTSQGYAGNGAPLGFATSLGGVFLLEMVLTFFFVLVIHRVTRDGNPAKAFAPIAIGFTLFLTQLVAHPD